MSDIRDHLRDFDPPEAFVAVDDYPPFEVKDKSKLYTSWIDSHKYRKRLYTLIFIALGIVLFIAVLFVSNLAWIRSLNLSEKLKVGLLGSMAQSPP